MIYIFLEQNTSNPAIRNRYDIVTKNNPDDPEPIIKTVALGNLFKYRDLKAVSQNYNARKANLNEDSLLETYLPSFLS